VSSDCSGNTSTSRAAALARTLLFATYANISAPYLFPEIDTVELNQIQTIQSKRWQKNVKLNCPADCVNEKNI